MTRVLPVAIAANVGEPTVASALGMGTVVLVADLAPVWRFAMGTGEFTTPLAVLASLSSLAILAALVVLVLPFSPSHPWEGRDIAIDPVLTLTCHRAV